MHKSVFENETKEWLHPHAYKVQEETPTYEDDKLAVPIDKLLTPQDFEVVINPMIHAETKKQIFDWEYCLSFPSLRCMVKRPVAIQVSYLDSKGDLIEQEMKDFSARMFLHELDHINGRTMTHWKLSEGNIDILEDKEEENMHLMSTVEFYKNKIAEMKEAHKSGDLFEDKRKYEEVVSQQDG